MSAWISLPMTSFTPLLSGAWGLTLSALTVAVLIDNGGVATVQRARYGRQLRQVRMQRMLDMRGIGRREYLRGSSVAKLRSEIADCRNCAQKSECDAAYLSGEAARSRYVYCPNTPALDALIAARAIPA